FTVTLSRVSSQTVTVKYATADGTAIAPGDFTALALNTLTFPAGQVSNTSSVAVKGDTTVQPDATFFATLSSPTNAWLVDAHGMATLQNDDGALTASGGAKPPGNAAQALANTELSPLVDAAIASWRPTGSGASAMAALLPIPVRKSALARDE